MIVLGCCRTPIEGASLTFKREVVNDLDEGEVRVTVYECDGVTPVTDADVSFRIGGTGPFVLQGNTDTNGQIIIPGLPLLGDPTDVFAIEVNSPTEGYWIENNFNDGDGDLTHSADLVVRITSSGSCTAPVYDWTPYEGAGSSYDTIDTCTTDANGECCTTLVEAGDVVDVEATGYVTRTELTINVGHSTTIYMCPDGGVCGCGARVLPETLTLNDGVGDITLTADATSDLGCGATRYTGSATRSVSRIATITGTGPGRRCDCPASGAYGDTATVTFIYTPSCTKNNGIVTCPTCPDGPGGVLQVSMCLCRGTFFVAPCFTPYTMSECTGINFFVQTEFLVATSVDCDPYLVDLEVAGFILPWQTGFGPGAIYGSHPTMTVSE